MRVRVAVLLLAGMAAVMVLAAVGCGDDPEGDDIGSKSGSKPEQRVPPAVQKFADQLQGCVDGEATGPTNYGGAIGAKQTAGLEPVAAVEDSGAKSDFLVFSSKAKAEEASRQLVRYRSDGGKTEVRGLVLLAHTQPLGDLRCLETARRAAGSNLPDAPPAPAQKLSAADRDAVIKASEVAGYCTEQNSTAFPDRIFSNRKCNTRS